MSTEPRTGRATRLTTILLILLLAACRASDDTGARAARSSSSDPQRAAAPAPAAAPAAERSTALVSITPIPSGPWTDLARRLVNAQDLTTAVAVTRQVLAHGGVATFDGDRILVAATAPAARFQATPLESVRLALEARRRQSAGRLTAAELAQMLEGFGWPFQGGRPGRRDRAARPWREQLPDEMKEAIRAEEEAKEEAERNAAREREEAIEAARQEAMQRDAELVERMKEVELRWQKARQAVAKATPEGKPAADKLLQEALAARNALIAERRAAREQAIDAGREARERARAEERQAARLEEIREQIGPDFRAGEQLMDMLAVWVRAAAENPKDPRSFTPLFLAEMARLQDPPVDLAGSRFRRPRHGEGPPVDLRGAPRSQQLRLTLLEVEMIAAAFYREAATSAAVMPANGWMGRDPSLALAGFRTSAQDPCSAFRKSLGDLGGEIAGTVASEVTGTAIDKAAGAALDPADAAAFGKAMSALGIATKLAKLTSFYSDSRIAVTVEPSSTHKPPEGQSLVTYTATAGVSEEEWNEYERVMNAEGSTIDRAMRDCFGNLGLPTAPELSDLAKQAEDWLVEWILVEGMPDHAWFSLRNNKFYLPGRRAMKLVRSGPYSATARFVVDIHPEPERLRSGRIVTTYVTAQASLDAAVAPSLTILVGAIKGGFGLADSLLDLFAGWFQFMNMPKAYGTLNLDYHCGKPTTLHETSNPVGDGGGGDGPNDCVLAAGDGG